MPLRLFLDRFEGAGEGAEARAEASAAAISSFVGLTSTFSAILPGATGAVDVVEACLSSAAMDEGSCGTDEGLSTGVSTLLALAEVGTGPGTVDLALEGEEGAGPKASKGETKWNMDLVVDVEDARGVPVPLPLAVIFGLAAEIGVEPALGAAETELF